MEDLHNTAPPIAPHSSTSTFIQEPAPSSDLTATSQALDLDSTLAHKFIGTTELCEKILGYLSCTDLCRAKRVCRTFRDVIDHSLMLQRHLFLSPCSEILRGGFIETSEERHVLYNFHTLLSFEAPPNPQSDFQVQLRLVRDHNPNGNRFARRYSECPISTLNQLTQTFGDVSGLSDHSSLRSMYVSNPPVKRVRITYSNTSQQYVEKDRIFKISRMLCSESLSCDEGITFGKVFEWTEKIIAQQLRSEFVRRANPFARFAL